MPFISGEMEAAGAFRAGSPFNPRGRTPHECTILLKGLWMFQRCSLDQADSLRCLGFVKSDLRAQLAPLNRYGPTSVSFALADGVRALLGAWRRPPAPKEGARC
jgi:hypothetical protein